MVATHLAQIAERATLVIDPIICAELAVGLARLEDLDDAPPRGAALTLPRLLRQGTTRRKNKRALCALSGIDQSDKYPCRIACPPMAARTKSAGVCPLQRRKALVKALGSEKPSRNATSAIPRFSSAR